MQLPLKLFVIIAVPLLSAGEFCCVSVLYAKSVTCDLNADWKFVVNVMKIISLLSPKVYGCVTSDNASN